MAVPLIISVLPATGPTGGQTLVTLATNNLREHPDPPITGPFTGPLQRTVQVLFGDVPATDVRVISQGRATCLSPIHDPGRIDVTVKNLDDNGDPIVGEEATKANAYTFQRPNLTTESDFTRVVRTLLRELKRQILPEVSLTVHTDFDDETGDFLNITKVASLPALVLIGPDTSENRFFSQNGTSQEIQPDGSVQIRRQPYTVDLEFQMVGASALTKQLLDLLAATIGFFQRNKYLVVDRDASDPSLGTVRYEMDITPDGEPKITTRRGESNVRSFSGTMVIRGVDIEALAGVVDDIVVGESRQITEVELQVDPPLVVPEDEERLPFPFDLDHLPPVQDIGPFTVDITESEE